jgi:pSer/pThr/pTyr-binding forkhead associated (FHA) protein
MAVDTDVKRSSLPLLIPLGEYAKNPPIKLSRPVFVIGSKPNCRIHLKSTTVSSTHAMIVQTRHLTYIRDLCSRTHVYVNGLEVKEAVLQDGDQIAIGRFTFRYQGPKNQHGVEPPVGPAALEVSGAELPIPVEERSIVVGRRPTCDLPLLEESVSTAHAVIFAWEGKRFIRDLWSRTGTFLNGRRIHEQELAPGDLIRCGETDIKYVPSLEEAAFAVIEGASDSIIAESPKAEEVDLGLDITPQQSAAEAPLELILPPQTPAPRVAEPDEDLLGLELQTVEPSAHDTAHVPLSIDEPRVEKAPPPVVEEIAIDALPLTPPDETAPAQTDSDLPRRGWRSAIQESESPVEPQATNPPGPEGSPVAEDAALEPTMGGGFISTQDAPLVEESAPATPVPEIIESTQPTPESAQALDLSEEAPAEPAPGSAVELTDTTFGRSLAEFEGDSLGPIVETPGTVAQETPAPQESPAPIAPPVPAPEFQALPIEPDVTLVPPPIETAATVDASALVPAEQLVPIVEEPVVEAPHDDVPAVAPTEEPASPQPLHIEEPAAEAPHVEAPAITPVEEPAATELEHVEEPVAEAPHVEALTVAGIEQSAPPEPEPIEEPAVDAAHVEAAVVAHAEPLLPEQETSAEPQFESLALEFSQAPAGERHSDSVPAETLANVAEETTPFEPVATVDFSSAVEPEATAEIAAVMEPIPSGDVVPEAPLALDDETPPALTPDDTAVLVLTTVDDAEAIPEAAPEEALFDLSVEEPLILEPLPENEPTIATTNASDGLATIDLSATPEPVVQAPPVVSEAAPVAPMVEAVVSETEEFVELDPPVLDEFPSDGPARQSSVADAAPQTRAEQTSGPETSIEPAPVHAAIDETTLLESALPADDEAPEPLIDSTPASTADALDLGKIAPTETFSATVDDSASLNLPGLTEPAIEKQGTLAPAPLDQALEFTDIDSSTAADESLDECATLDLLDNDPVHVDPSNEQTAPITADVLDVPDAADIAPAQTLEASESVADAFDFSKLAPQEESLAVEPAAPETSAARSTAPLVDSIDLSSADKTEPLNESAALDLLARDEAPVETTTPAEPPQAINVTLDHTAVEAPAPDTFAAVEPQTETFTDILLPGAEDEIVGPPPITEKSKPVPPPAAVDEREVKVEPAAGIRPRRAAKPRVIRNAFGQDPDAPRPGEIVIPPFSDSTPGLGGGPTLSSLSQPPVRETDVFSEVARPAQAPDEPVQASGDIFAEPTGAESESIFAEEIARSLPRSSLMDLGAEAEPSAASTWPSKPKRTRPSVTVEGARPVVAFTDPEAANAASERRQKLIRRAPILMGMMILAIGVAWALIWTLVPVTTRVQAAMTFKNFGALTQREQRLEQAKQLDKLSDEVTRRTAARMLQNRHPGISPGWIEEPAKYAKLEMLWPDATVGQMVLRYEGTDPQNDKARLEGVALAMYDANSQTADETRKLTSRRDYLQNLLKTDQAKIEDLKTKAEQARAIVEATPTKAQIDKLKADDAALEAKYNDAISKAKDAQAELDRLKKQQDAESAASAPGVDPALADTEVQRMSKEAEVLSNRLADARKERADLAARARATLDAAYDEFKKQVDIAQGAAKDNPQLAAYVSAAQNLQQAIRDLTDQYIKHQQEDYTALNTLKDQIVATMNDRKATLMANDPKLKELTEQKEITTRQYNAAVGAGLDKDASDKKNELKLIDTAIKAQQEIVSNDPVYNDIVTKLQQMIDQKQKSINDERTKTNEKLASLRQSFSKSAQSVEQLPAEQKDLASKMQDRLAEIDAARKQYAEASDAAAADADTNIRRMNDELQALQTNIEVRKKQIAAANSPELRKAADEQRQKDLAARIQSVEQATQVLADARAKYQTNQSNLSKALAASQQAQVAAEDLERATRDRQTLERQQDYNKLQWDKANADVSRAVEPVEPSEEDVHTVGDPIDNRAKIGLATSGGIFAFFAFWIMMTLRGAARESQYAYTPAIEPLETPATPKMVDAEENEAVVA